MTSIHIAKYWRILSISWQNGLVYRTSLVLWRLRQFLSSLMALTVWQVLFAGQTDIFAYTASEMTNYIFFVALLQSVILSTALHGLANTIYSGDLSGLLLKPVNLLSYWISYDLADKLKNVAFVLVEMMILAALFRPQLPQPSPEALLIVGLGVFSGLSLYFIVMLLLGSLGFWSPETWGPRFLFFMFVDLTAGKLFPLDILPTALQQFLLWTPFPYLSYFQIQVLLGRWSTAAGWQGLAAALAWCGILGGLTWLVWRRGFKTYTAAGI